MQTKDFLQQIQTAFSKQLPGPDAHKTMTPGKRPLTRDEVPEIDTYRHAAVAIICFPKDGEIHGILTQRPVYEGTHGGQISFPGGKMEAEDENLEHAARRESFEEIGWKMEEKNCLGQLTELFIPVSKFSVQPFLYYLDSAQDFVLDPREVQEVIQFPLSKLAKDDVIKKTVIQYSSGVRLKDVPYYDIDNRIVWGATAIVLSELKAMLFD